MPQAKATKFVRSFVKGLVTEAGYLTYPEDASNDELNTNLHVRGNRTRRLGLDFEPSSSGTSFTFFSDTSVTQEYFWRSVGNKAETNFLVVQVGSKVYFYDASISPLSEGRKNFGISLTSYKSPTASIEDVSNARCDFAIGKGYLFIVNQYCDPISVEYFPDTDNISTARIILQVRDFDGVNDNLSNDEEPGFLSGEHQYNLRNQGWVRPGTNSVQANYPVEPDVIVPIDTGSGDSGSGGTGYGAGTGGAGEGYGGSGSGGDVGGYPTGYGSVGEPPDADGVQQY